MSQPIEFGDVLPKTLFDEIGKELFKKDLFFQKTNTTQY